jgi:hypothetical protein
VQSNKLLEYCKTKNIESERLFGEKIIEYKSEQRTQIATKAEMDLVS